MLDRKQFTQKLATNLRRAREDKGMSQETLAHEAGLYRTYVGHIEKGRYLPSSYVLYKLVKALKRSIKDLFPS